jgi:hypothetical protein
MCESDSRKRGEGSRTAQQSHQVSESEHYSPNTATIAEG